MSLDQYATPGERKVVTKLVEAILAEGYVIDVNDGEETTVKGSSSKDEVLNALATTDHDFIITRNPAALYGIKGTFFLVWGNDPSGEELIADHSDNGWSDKIAEGAEA